MKRGAHARPTTRSGIARKATWFGTAFAGLSFTVLGLYAIYNALFGVFAGPTTPVNGLVIAAAAVMVAGLALSGVGYGISRRDRRTARLAYGRDKSLRRARAA
jgi:hypothetical protein